MIRFRAAFEVADLRAFETDSSEHYFIPGPGRTLARPAPFWVYEVPAEVLVGRPFDGDIDLGEVADAAALVSSLERLKSRLARGERP